MSKLRGATGRWVSGDDFWGRELELALFLRYLREGANLLLIAQRRIGKTSLMKEAAVRLENEAVCVFVDLEGCQNSPDAIAEITAATHGHRSLPDRMGKWIGGILGNVTEVNAHVLKLTLRSGLDDGNWRQRGDELLDALASGKQPVVVFLDEAPILVNRILKGDDFTITPDRRAKADALLSWLRSAMLRHQGKIRFVITGSIGLEPIVHQARLSATLNHLQPFELGPWTPEAAAGALEALAAEYRLTYADGVVANMLDRLGTAIPHHVQVYFDQVYQACHLRGFSVVTMELAGEIYEKRMLGARGHAELSHLEERLRAVLGIEQETIAIELLTEAAVTGLLTPKAVLAIVARNPQPEGQWAPRADTILEILVHDGYLEQTSSGYRFHSKLQRDWWRRRFGSSHTTAVEQ